MDRIGGGVVLSVRNDVTGYWSKALGFGFTEPITADLMDRVISLYREEGNSAAVIQIAPTVLPPDWPEICRRQGIQADSPWFKLACPIEDFRPGAETDLHIERVGSEHATDWARATLNGFGMPLDLEDMVAPSVTDPYFRPFAAWDGDEIVATANLFVHGQVASLNAAATLPSHRNRGAQSALIAARVAEAADAGCRWLAAETGKPNGGEVNPSLNNLQRAGLKPLYERENWVWRAEADDPSI
jgi:GNAT superfamily N-acetyltransferase